MGVMTRRFNVGGFVDHHGDSLFGDDFVHAGIVSLGTVWILFVAPVSGDVDYAVRGADDDGGGAGDGVKDVDEFYGEMFRDLDFFVFEGVYADVVHVGDIGKLGHLALDHADGEIGGVDGGGIGEFGEEMFTGADVIKVGMGEEDGFDLFAVIF